MKKKYPKFDELKEGDNIKVKCQNDGCTRFLSMKVVYASTMQLYCPRYNSYFDMRNDVWHCFQHKNK
jgi:hypothetical protein